MPRSGGWSGCSAETTECASPRHSTSRGLTRIRWRASASLAATLTGRKIFLVTKNIFVDKKIFLHGDGSDLVAFKFTQHQQWQPSTIVNPHFYPRSSSCPKQSLYIIYCYVIIFHCSDTNIYIEKSFIYRNISKSILIVENKPLNHHTTFFTSPCSVVQ